MSEFSKQRIVGLDIVRSLAILCVLVSHGLWILQEPGHHYALRFGGQFGVELFFVLSGFLIGTILLKHCDAGLKPRDIGQFWVRRWLRTVPAYFIVLLFLWLAMGRFDWTYFVFLQGVLRYDFVVLPVSWSLIIEEWFYLIFPLLSAAMLLIFPKRGYAVAAGLLLVLPMLYHQWQYTQCTEALRQCFEQNIRKSSLRFDTIALGAILAYIHARYDLRKIFAGKILPLSIVTAVVSAITLGFVLNIVLRFPGTWLPQDIGLSVLYPLMGLCGMCLVTLGYVWQPSLPRAAVQVVYFISLTSYSNYLWHMLVRDALADALPRGLALFCLYMAASMLVAWLGYVLTERPFLQLRKRLTQP